MRTGMLSRISAVVKNIKDSLAGNFKWRKMIRGGLILAVFLLFLLASFVLLVFTGGFGRIPGPQELSKIQNPLASEIYTSDGVLMGKYYIHNRQYLKPKDITVDLRNALIATEDARFYHHDGIDFRSLVRVLVKTVFLGDRSSGGGSTLTQQLVKNLYPRKNHGILSMPVNKIREMITAVRIERLYTKEEILMLYLSTVPFGENSLGIKSASQMFFSKDPADLDTEEMALLVGMLKATDIFHPLKHPENALTRRNVVLSQMEKYHYLPSEIADSLQELPLDISYNPLPHDAGIAPYFREMLRHRVAQWAMENLKANGEPYDIYNDGLKIYTTIDSRLQGYAEKAMKEHMAHLQALFEKTWEGRNLWQGIPNEKILINYQGEYHDTMPAEPARKMEVFTWEGMAEKELNTFDSIRHYLQFLQAGFLAMDVRTAEVRSWVGGIDYEYFKYDHVLAKRQTGSVFKPLVYLAALEKGISPCDYYPNDSVVYTEFDNWIPRNANRTYGGYYSLKGALTHSINTVSVHLLMENGFEPVFDLSRRAGIDVPLPAVPSLALGTAEVSLLEMTRVYQAIANGGVTKEPVYILRIENKEGDILYRN
jgi:penicillin-binding protein 1A